MNTIYLKTEKSQRKVKTFTDNQYLYAMSYGWKLAYKDKTKEYFIITHNSKALKFNTQTVL